MFDIKDAISAEFSNQDNACALKAAPGKVVTVTPVHLVCQEIAQIYLAEKMAPRPERRVNLTIGPASYQAVTGRYDYGNGVLMDVTTEDDRR